MAYDDLRDWIKALENAGELKRITEEVSPELEITEITDRVSKIGARPPPRAKPQQKPSYSPGGPALLFENIKGHPGHKVLINQFGSSAAWPCLSASSISMRSPAASPRS